MYIYRYRLFMLPGFDQVGQIEVIKALHHCFKHLGRHHVAHDFIVIEYCDGQALCAAQDG